MFSVGGLCPGCKRPVVDHMPSARYPRETVPTGKVDAVNGSCIVEGARAPQKCCWVLLRAPMTPAEYREHFQAGTIPLEQRAQSARTRPRPLEHEPRPRYGYENPGSPAPDTRVQ